MAQETWIAVIRGIDGFEQRSSLKTWIFRILINRARTRGERDSRVRPFSTFEVDGDEPAVSPDRFYPSGRMAGCWASPPYPAGPEDQVLASESGAHLLAAIDELPPAQRAVITLRDVQELTAAEVCELLEISDANQRVLLHRARSKVRNAYENYLRQKGTGDLA